MLNVVAIMGRLARDPEMRQTTTGKNVASFRIACDRGRRDANGQSVADWIDVVAWDRQAEFVCRYFQKGSLIVVDGRLQSRQYQDKTGANRTAVEVVANNINFAGPKSSNAGDGNGYQNAAPSYQNAALPVRPLWRQLPAIPPAMPMTLPSSTTATTCRSDTKRSIR